MIARGTGITSLMQIASEILRHPEDKTAMSLIFACRFEGDLLMRHTIDKWTEKFPHRFSIQSFFLYLRFHMMLNSSHFEKGLMF